MTSGRPRNEGVRGSSPLVGFARSQGESPREAERRYCSTAVAELWRNIRSARAVAMSASRSSCAQPREGLAYGGRGGAANEQRP
jgi:hypothetical protein